MTNEFREQTLEKTSPLELRAPAISPAAIQALAAREPWLAPICARLQGLLAMDLSSSPVAHELLRYIADALPASKAGPWRAILDAWPAAERSSSGEDAP